MSKSLFVRTRQRRTARLRAQRREELCNPVIKYLMSRENEAETLDEQEHYKFCRRVVSLALEGSPEPFVGAFYYHYGRHPNKLIPEWLWREEKDRRLGIPDYDPTIPIRRPASGLASLYQMQASGWPDQQNTLRDPQEEEYSSQPRIPRKSPQGLARSNAFPPGLPPDSRLKPVHWPPRRIVSRTPVIERGKIRYYTEQLECGHSHIEFLGGNPPHTRRQCKSCSLAGPMEHGSVSTAFLRSCSGLGSLWSDGFRNTFPTAGSKREQPPMERDRLIERITSGIHLHRKEKGNPVLDKQAIANAPGSLREVAKQFKCTFQYVAQCRTAAAAFEFHGEGL